MKDNILLNTQASGWFFPEAVWHCLDSYEKGFIENEFTGLRTLDYYQKRLELIGFHHKEKILDAACGMGQWSIALAQQNQAVIGIDINSSRLLVAKSLSESHKLNNCSFWYSPLEKIPFDDFSFDGIFCYGAFMFTEMDQCLSEFYRLLKPGGIIYLNANAIGWYAHLLIDRGIRSKNLAMVKTVAKMGIRSLLQKKKNIIITRKWLEHQITQIGFRIIGIDIEGHLQTQSDSTPLESAYPPAYYGLESILEILVTKDPL